MTDPIYIYNRLLGWVPEQAKSKTFWHKGALWKVTARNPELGELATYAWDDCSLWNDRFYKDGIVQLDGFIEWFIDNDRNIVGVTPDLIRDSVYYAGKNREGRDRKAVWVVYEKAE